MIAFRHPAFFLFLPAALLLMWWWARRPRQDLAFSHIGFFQDLPRGRADSAERIILIARGLALILLIVGLTTPQLPDVHSRAAAEGIAVEMVLDTSASMAEPDFAWEGKPMTRLDAAKKVFRLFVQGGEGSPGEPLPGRPEDLIGLVTFATRPESVCPLTLSHSALLKMLDEEKPRTLPTESHTNIGDGLAWGLHRLEKSAATRRIIILLSDGEHNVPPPALTPRQAAQLAANRGIPVYAIDAGGDDGTSERPPANPAADSPVAIRESAVRSLQAVAAISKGKYFQAQNTAALVAACQEIDRLERTAIQSFVYRRYYDAFPWLGLMALCLWTLPTLLERTWLRRLP